MHLIDSHSHVQFPAYDQDRELVIENAKKIGMRMLAVGTQASTSAAAIKLAQAYPNTVWATVGFHPSHLSPNWYHDDKEQLKAAPEQFDIARLRELAIDSKCVAIGECGLDYFRIKNNESGIKNRQKEVFLQQAELAQELQKPLMIHCRPAKGTDDAYEDLLSIIPDSRFIIPKIIHFYVGSPEITKKLVDAGCYFTFGGVITFSRDYDASIDFVPLERILLETDCPYVAPQSKRGQRNEPVFISETYQRMAEIRNLEYDKLVTAVADNFQKVFFSRF